MRSNPYRLTLFWAGLILLIVGFILSTLPGNAGFGAGLMALGAITIIGWFVVAAIQWVPGPAKPRDAAADAEYEAIKKSERDPNGLR